MKKAAMLLLTAVMTMSAHTVTGAEFNDGFYNPLRSEYMLGDPWMVKHEGMYYCTCSDGSSITVTPSDTISGQMFKTAKAKTIFTGALHGLMEIWAPELHFYNGHWYALFAADTDNNNILHRMYAIRSETDDIFGEYGPPALLELPEGQWAIDGTHFEHEGRLYHIWSGWKNEEEGSSIWRQYLYITKMERPDAVKEDAKRVRISAPLKFWESSVLPQNEGPAVLKSPDGTVHLAYSANYSGSDDYCIGLLTLTGADPMDAGAWEKSSEPVFVSDKPNNVYAPGHCSFVKSPDGAEDWIVYHIAKRSGAGWDRLACAQKIEWMPDGTPDFGTPAPLNTLHTLPGGESANREIYPVAGGAVSEGAYAVENAGAYSGKAVLMDTIRGKASVTLTVPSDGRYSLIIRYSNPEEDATTLRVSLSDGKRLSVYAGPSGADHIFSLVGISLELLAGENEITLQGAGSTLFDSVIIDLDSAE
jgi:GH43 family beta-xylosidase